jgi:biotin carboxyl carrier protein
MGRALASGVVKWLLTFALLANLFVLAFFLHREMRAEREREKGEGDKVAKAQFEEKPRPDEVFLPVSQADSYATEEIRREPNWVQPVTAYGRVVPNPAAAFEVRSPFAGTLRKGPWPEVGKWVEAGTELAWVDVRVGPQEKLDMRGKLAEARARHEGAVESVRVHEARVKRLRDTSGAPLREVEDALLQLTEARTQESIAARNLDLWRQAVDEIDRKFPAKGGLWGYPVYALADGEVTDLAARPGEAVDAGAVLLRLADPRRILVRLDIPPETLASGAPQDVQLTAAGEAPPALRGASNQPEPGKRVLPVAATRVGPAPRLGASQFAAYFYEVRPPRTSKREESTGAPDVRWRPGLFVQADLPAAAPRAAVSVPRDALLYHQGRALVYVRLEDRSKRLAAFARREVRVLGQRGERWILDPDSFRAGDRRVVSDEPQVLLSAQFFVDND